MMPYFDGPNSLIYCARMTNKVDAGQELWHLRSQSEGLPMSAPEAGAYGLRALMTKACNLRKGFAEGAA